MKNYRACNEKVKKFYVVHLAGFWSATGTERSCYSPEEADRLCASDHFTPAKKFTGRVRDRF